MSARRPFRTTISAVTNAIFEALSRYEIIEKRRRRMREALSSLELLVVMNVAMTETARLAHDVLPSPSQFEKFEATLFNSEVPRNAFQLRHSVIPAPSGPLVEPEIHARLIEALGVVTANDRAAPRCARVSTAILESPSGLILSSTTTGS